MSHYHSRISANQSWFHIPFKEVLAYKDLLWLLVKRDLTAIYKQTVLGPLWFAIPPLCTSVIFTIIFGGVAKIDTGPVPHFVFYMCGNVFWHYFVGCLNHSSTSLITNAQLLRKVYFPRLVIPLYGVFVNLAHFALNFVVLLGFYLYFFFWTENEMVASPYLPLIVLLLIQCACIGFGVGLWVAALSTKYKDFRFALPLIAQLWMWVTPIAYPAALVVKPQLQFFLWLNPMSFVVEAVRLLFTGSGTVSLTTGAVSVGMTVLLLLSGLLVFNKVQRTFVDTI